MVKINSLYEEEQHDNSYNSIKNKLALVINQGENSFKSKRPRSLHLF